MGGSHFSPAFAKAATVALAWLPAVAVVMALLNGAVTTNLTVTVLLLCGLATLGIVVMYPPAETAVLPGAPGTPGAADTSAGAAGAETRAAQMKAILDALDEPVLATDSAGTVVLANRAAAEFFGRAEGQITGMVVEELFSHGELLGLHGAALAGARRAAQIRMPRPGGVRMFQVLAAPLWAEAGEASGTRHGVLLTLRDVTELATAVQLKTDFVANASHELRTPLASIRAAAETLSESAADDPVMLQRLAAMIAANVARLEDLTRDLLDLSRLESPEARVERALVRASEIAESLGEVFATALAARRLGLEFDFDPAVEHLDTDARLLTLILRNLVENSTKFANEGSTIRVVGESVPAGARPGKSGLRLKVIDQGIGIPLAQQGRIFERFYQADPSRSGQAERRGTGLGLSIVKHAVKNLGGTVSVSSVWKEGTTITVEIPDCVNGA